MPILLFFLQLMPFLFFFLLFLTKACQNDTYCQDCNFYIANFFPLRGYYACASCFQDRVVDQSTGNCQCNAHSYQKSNGECNACLQICESCTAIDYCTQCVSDLGRELVNGNCACIEGYEEGEDYECIEKENIVLVVLSSIGSVVCMVLGSVICIVLRFRRNSKVHTTEDRKKKNSNNLEVEVYQEQLQNSGGFFFSSQENQFFKPHEICSICLDTDSFFVTSCGHYFHGKCIYSWLENKTTCPNCNAQIKHNQIKRWCEECKETLMPVVMNVTVQKKWKKKKSIKKSEPIPIQICEDCVDRQQSSSTNKFDKQSKDLQ